MTLDITTCSNSQGWGPFTPDNPLVPTVCFVESVILPLPFILACFAGLVRLRSLIDRPSIYPCQGSLFISKLIVAGLFSLVLALQLLGAIIDPDHHAPDPPGSGCLPS
ncbi:hypothetical protein BJ684DRAFT_20913 [Piptocephalis cylindrospora]|uniref:ABC transporter TMD0 domain-containing protein n=1 Tax=Piptocephalis cylindrospora TaxID=1907219 RepID=A0A4V1IXX3_9FUNG|nr:hypothetical protein BJ684DRAFT_20913 [Piptocephalis cylindrospora]|eukprot:RKP12559.1 hypothetical protein BJ684DRAFT_20913 [Piptocephalis cylindrospora]